MNVLVIHSNVDKEQHHEKDDSDKDEILNPRANIDELQHSNQGITNRSGRENSESENQLNNLQRTLKFHLIK